jgi:TatD DNase family protein
MRGKKNTPAFVVHTAEVVAGLKKVSVDQLREQTNKNAMFMFPKIKW